MYLYVIIFLPHLVLVLLYIYSIISFTRYSSSYIYILYTFYLLVRFSYFKIYNCIIFYICMYIMCFMFSPLNFFGYWTLNKYYYYYYVNEQGILVIGRSLKHSRIPHPTKHPVILPRSHIISTSINRDAHNKRHLVREWILSLVRRRFWKVRCLIYKLSSSCITWRRLFSCVCKQKMSYLPELHVNFDKSTFSHVAVDCFTYRC